MSMYTEINFKTKKAFKEYFATGQPIRTYQPGGMFPGVKDGPATIEGPHYPRPHTWYASVTLSDGVVTKIKG